MRGHPVLGIHDLVSTEIAKAGKLQGLDIRAGFHRQLTIILDYHKYRFFYCQNSLNCNVSRINKCI